MGLLFGILLTVLVVSSHAKNGSPKIDNEDSGLRAAAQNENTTTRGTPARPGEFPSVVSLRINKPNEIRRCTGTIINQDYVLTSGSCIKDAEEILVEFGCLHFYKCNETMYGTGILHPDYKEIDGIFLNDLGLVHLQENMPDRVFVNMSIPPLLGKDCMVVGYSNLIEGDDIMRKLFKHMLLSMLPCHKLAPNLDINRYDVLCATTQHPEELELEDYGGPLFCNAVQVGVASHSFHAKTEKGETREFLIWMPLSKSKNWILTGSNAASLWFNAATPFALLLSLSYCV